MVGVEPIRKAAELVCHNEPTHLRQHGSLFPVAKVAPLIQPCLEAGFDRLRGLPYGPAGDAKLRCQLPGSGHQGKPVDGPAYLVACSLWGELVGQTLDFGPQALAVRVQVARQGMGIGTKGGAVVALCAGLEGVGKGAAIGQAVQALKRAIVAGAARDLDGAHLHSGLGTLARAGGMVFQ
ncbi:hypothetical protein D3C79_815720 [compost metagenome]